MLDLFPRLLFLIAGQLADFEQGLGSPVFDKLEAELAKAAMSLPATKGFEIGSGFAGRDLFWFLVFFSCSWGSFAISFGHDQQDYASHCSLQGPSAVLIYVSCETQVHSCKDQSTTMNSIWMRVGM